MGCAWPHPLFAALPLPVRDPLPADERSHRRAPCIPYQPRPEEEVQEEDLGHDKARAKTLAPDLGWLKGHTKVEAKVAVGNIHRRVVESTAEQ